MIELLKEFKKNKAVILELYKKYELDDILEVLIKEKEYDEIVELFHPIEVNNEYQMFFDYYTYSDNYHFSNPFNSIPDEVKEKLIKDILNIDFEKVRMIKIKNSLPRAVSGINNMINSTQDVRYYSEPACLEAMLCFYNNNIITISNDTSCVRGEKEFEGICQIWINYDSLSEENKEVVELLIKNNNAFFLKEREEKIVSIFVPCNAEETIGEVSDRLFALAKIFKKQKSYFGIVSDDGVISSISNKIYDKLYNQEMLPDNSLSYLDLFYSFVDDGLIKNNDCGELYVDDEGYYSITDFLKVIKQINPELFNMILKDNLSYGLYFDEVENRVWLSKAFYDKYINSVKELANDSSIKS